MAEQADPASETDVYDKVKEAPFQPLPPEVVQPTSSPTSSSTAPESDGDTSGEDDTAAPNKEQAQAAEAPPEFDPKFREPLTGLLYLDKTRRPYHETLNVPEQPLASLSEQQIRPGKKALEEILATLT